MIQESPIIEKTQKRKIRLSKEEKDHIERIATSLNKDYKDVQEVFLALVAYITMNFYSGENTFHVPYIGEFHVVNKKVVVPKGFELKEEITVTPSPAFHDLMMKLETKEKTWIEEFCMGVLFGNLNDKTNI